MKIGLLGGTGDFGEGLALRLAKDYEIIVGSRYKEKAEKKAEEYIKKLESIGIEAKIYGENNKRATELSDVVIITIPYEYTINTIKEFPEAFKDKVLVSPVVPFKKVNGDFIYIKPKEGSAAEQISSIVDAKVVAALHNVSAEALVDIAKEVEGDVIVLSNDDDAKYLVMDIIKSIKNLRPLDGGNLSNAHIVEAITPLLMNIGKRNKIKHPTIKILGEQDGKI